MLSTTMRTTPSGGLAKAARLVVVSAFGACGNVAYAGALLTPRFHADCAVGGESLTCKPSVKP